MSEKLTAIITTVESVAQGEELGTILVEEHFAACVSLLQMPLSIYKWEGSLTKSSEVMLLVKTSSGRASAALKKIKELHPYDTPEIITSTPDQVDNDYLKWALAQVKGKE